LAVVLINFEIMYFLSIFVIQIFLSITYSVHTTPIEQVVCKGGIEGELRFSKTGGCLTTLYSTRTTYSVELTNACTDLKMLQVIICVDFTFRKKEENLCLTTDNNRTQWQPCKGTKIKSHEWIKSDIKNGGATLEQQFKIEDNKTGMCMTLKNSFFYMERCSNAKNDKQLFHFKTTQVVKKGKIMNNEIFFEGIQRELAQHLKKQCLSMKYDEVAEKRIVQFQSCFPDEEDSSVNQEFTLYDTGYLIAKSKNNDRDYCVIEKAFPSFDRYGRSKTIKKLIGDECQESKKWEYNYCNGDICSLHIKDTDKCLDGTDMYFNRKDLILKECDYSRFQRFQWISGMFSEPELTYIKKGCNENGKISMEIATEWSYSKSEDTGVEHAVSGSLSFEYGHFSTSGGYERTKALSNAWEERNVKNSKMVMTCETYKDGSKFIGGCLWQLEVKMINMKNDGIFDWKPRVIACTPDYKKPICEAFTKCANPPTCSICIPTALEKESKKAKTG